MRPIDTSRLVALIAVAVPFAAMSVAARGGRDQVEAHGAPGRLSEPIVLTGADLSAFAGARANELWGYAYDHDTWEPVAVQMDERAANGNIVASENGVLDANDEVAFMADLVGARALSDASPPGIETCHPFAEVVLTDPLDADWTGYVYLFWSTTGPERALPPAVTWDPAARELHSNAYTLGLADRTADGFFGLKSLKLFTGATDLLDRLKIRVEVTLLGMTTTYDEESNMIAAPAVAPVSTGPVRVVLNAAGTAAAYARRVSLIGILDTSDPSVPGLIQVEGVELGLDFMPSAGPGTYRDVNTASPVPIDGAIDVVADRPWSPWRSVEFLDGRLVILSNPVDTGTDASNTFIDGGPFPPRDTGDGVTYGQTGVMAGSVDALNATGFPGVFVMLSPGQEIDAATLYEQSQQPLAAAVAMLGSVVPCPTSPGPSATPTRTPTGQSTTPRPTTPAPTPTGTVTWAYQVRIPWVLNPCVGGRDPGCSR